jgi:GNAT superfamily N-acetyltransferase
MASDAMVPLGQAGSVEIHPATPDRLGDLADLFETGPATRGCWCMWFINNSEEVRAGWRDGGNRTAFEGLAARADPPLGLIAYDGAVPVGWLAMGPRSRYPRAIGPRSRIRKARDSGVDDDVWLLPCFFVRVGYRRRGVTAALVAAAVDEAEAHGAKAVEGFPIADAYPKNQHDFVGKQRRFAECGFDCVAEPSPRRVVMRRNLR